MGDGSLIRMEWRLCHEVHELIDEGTLRGNEIGGNMTFGGGLFEQEGDFLTFWLASTMSSVRKVTPMPKSSMVVTAMAELVRVMGPGLMP